MSQKDQVSQRLEIHYYFKDETHSMDATIRNECERELLMLYKHLMSQLSFECKIETAALNEGGLKETWIFIGKNAAQIALLLTLIQIGISIRPQNNGELTKAQIENTKTDTELKKAQIENTNTDTEIKRNQIKEQLRKGKNVEVIASETLKSLEQEQHDTTETNHKVRWHTSNFYRRVSGYSKITKISSKVYSTDFTAPANEIVVERKDFIQFIQTADNLPAITDEDALIDIISPVLKAGNFNWRGIYNGESISFEMKDGIYKASVLDKQVEFLNGTAIKCVLKLSRRIDEYGNIIVSKRQVLIVLETVTNSKATQTIQGKNYIKAKKNQSNQIALNF
jgi:hypothetical protein